MRLWGGGAGGGTFACVVDQDPRFHLEVLRWFASLHGVAGVDPHDLVVHAVGGTSSEALALLEDKGVAVRPIELFDPRSPHCNKIAGALCLAEAGVSGMAVLTDTDIAICEDPRSQRLPDRAVASKLVDFAIPRLDTLRAIFKEASIALPPLEPLDRRSGQSTVAGNGNGGIYLVPGSHLPQVAAAWAYWARWLLERRELLGDWGTFVDQVAMALAIAAEGFEAIRLKRRWNLATNEPQFLPRRTGPPAVLHYHTRVDRMGLLSPTGRAAVDRRIRRVNAAIGELWQESFPNSLFWEWRYQTDPELGSGVGSRGRALDDKRELLTGIAAELVPSSTLDVGCGDGQATRGIPLGHYTGLDLSEEATHLAQLGRPDGEYHVGTIVDWPVKAELTICLDVLIHQPDMTTYEDLVRRLVDSASRALLISGYEHPSTSGSPVVHFHEPLSTTLQRVEPGAQVQAVRDLHEITTFLVLFAAQEPEAQAS
jgi:hypothetical protein